MSSLQVALLRGINVGRNGRISMADVRSLFIKAGCSNVETYGQSGNVVFECGHTPDLATPIPVIFRTAAMFLAALDRNPFLPKGVPEKDLHILFLKDCPSSEAIATLDPAYSPGDSFALLGNEVHLHLPNGVSNSKFANSYFDKSLGTVTTGRNWATLTKIRALLLARSSDS